MTIRTQGGLFFRFSGATGVPAFRTADNDTAVTGAHPIELYRRWFNRILGREG